MLNLLRIEGYKFRRFKPFYFCLAMLVILGIVGAVRGLSQNYINYYGIGIMHDGFVDSVQDCSFAFVISMLIAWYTGLDFTNRTVHRSIVTGGKRWMVIATRIMATSLMTFIFHLFLIGSQIVTFGKTCGYSLEGFCRQDLVWLGVVALQLIAENAFYTLITVICGNVYTALFACVIIAAIGGNTLRNVFVGNTIYEHSFFCFAKSASASDLIPCAICAIIAIIIFVGATCIYFNKKDVLN